LSIKRQGPFLPTTKNKNAAFYPSDGRLAAGERGEMISAQLIRQAETDMNGLHSACRAAASRRNGSAALRKEHLRAAEEFRKYQSPLLELWSAQAQRDIVAGSGGWRGTAILYLQISPRFFRSGYLRDVVCTRLKQASLTHSERKDVQDALLTSIVRRPSAGSFRYDCRLAIKVADRSFLQELRALCKTRNPWISGRAQRMEQVILRHAPPSFPTDI
jgi:hypothetical protein